MGALVSLYTLGMNQQELKSAMVAAMKARDEVRLSVIRGLMTAITNDLVAKGKKPTDEASPEDITALIRRASKQRKDSIEQFTAGGRADLADNEKKELAVLETLLPPDMSREEVEKVVRAKAAEMGATDKSKAGILMGVVMKDLKGKVDGTVVKEVVEQVLG